MLYSYTWPKAAPVHTHISKKWNIHKKPVKRGTSHLSHTHTHTHTITDRQTQTSTKRAATTNKYSILYIYIYIYISRLKAVIVVYGDCRPCTDQEPLLQPPGINNC